MPGGRRRRSTSSSSRSRSPTGRRGRSHSADPVQEDFDLLFDGGIEPVSIHMRRVPTHFELKNFECGALAAILAVLLHHVCSGECLLLSHH